MIDTSIECTLYKKFILDKYKAELLKPFSIPCKSDWENNFPDASIIEDMARIRESIGVNITQYSRESTKPLQILCTNLSHERIIIDLLSVMHKEGVTVQQIDQVGENNIIDLRRFILSEDDRRYAIGLITIQTDNIYQLGACFTYQSSITDDTGNSITNVKPIVMHFDINKPFPEKYCLCDFIIQKQGNINSA